MSEKSIFEQAGLQINKDRVLTYSQLRCPLGCRYCFSADLDFNQKENVAYLTDEQLHLLKSLPEEVKIIMPGCDTEFFQDRRDALQIIEKLLQLKKDIALMTKLPLSEAYIEKLRILDVGHRAQGNIITLSVSIPCMESAKIWEPEAPAPAKRIQTLRHAFEAELKTLVAIRPLLPTISDEELSRIVDETKDYCYGYYSGPLYLKDLEHSVLSGVDKQNLDIRNLQPHWMTEGNPFYQVERRGQMQILERILQSNGKPLFEGAAEALNYLKKL